MYPASADKYEGLAAAAAAATAAAAAAIEPLRLNAIVLGN
jgi:hypothetical protein